MNIWAGRERGRATRRARAAAGFFVQLARRL